MFGLIKPCRHVLDDDAYTRWQAHLCGLCLTLGTRDGQWTRALTNTDAVALSILVEAQQAGPAERVLAGRCPGRGMRTAPVVPPEALSVRLGATTSLALASAKVADRVAERTVGLNTGGPGSGLRDRVASRAADVLRRRALDDDEVNRALAVPQLLHTLAGQASLEKAFHDGDAPMAVTTPAAEVTAEVFASSATVSGKVENAEVLREMGRDFGTLAHLLDAVADQEDDRRAGDFNPVTAAGWPLARVRTECEALAARLRLRVAALVLQDGRLVTWLFTVAITRAIAHTFASVTPGGPGEYRPDLHKHPEPAAADEPAGDPAGDPGSGRRRRGDSGRSDWCECCTCCACLECCDGC